MKFIFAMTLLVLVAAAAARGKNKAGGDDANKVKVAVYYESLCPDSKKFITQQLGPVWRELHGSVKVKLVPYGKATHDKKNGQWEFTCQHGPDECYGNKVQACILKDRHLVDNDKVELLVCLMSQDKPDKALRTCAELVKKSSETERLQQCADSGTGSQLLAHYGDKTNAVQAPLASVPTIVLNENLATTNQEEALSDLKGAVCRLAAVKPAACGAQ